MPSPAAVRLALLWLAGADLRLTLLAVPPVLPLIHRDLRLDEKGVGALSGLPVLLLGLAAIPGSLLIARIGARRVVILGLLIVGISSALRGLGPSAGLLFGMTFWMGVGIAMIQPALPALVRLWFPGSIPRATGVWSNGLLVGELLGAALTLPVVLPLAGGSWELSFAVWGAPVLLTAGLVALGTRHVAAETAYWRGAWLPDWRDARLWQLGLLQSAAGLIYFGANTFIPDYLHATEQAELVGPSLAALNAGQLPASLAIGLLPWRILGRGESSLAIGLAVFAGLGGMLLLRGAWALPAAAALLGFCAAAILVLTFALPALLAAPNEVSRLSAGTFTISYVVSFLATLAAGAAWDATHVAATAFLPVVVGGAIALLLGPRLLAASASAREGAGPAG